MRRAALVFGLALLAAPAAFAGLFSAPEPELIYSGSGVGLEEGVLVMARTRPVFTSMATAAPSLLARPL